MIFHYILITRFGRGATGLSKGRWCLLFRFSIGSIHEVRSFQIKFLKVFEAQVFLDCQTLSEKSEDLCFATSRYRWRQNILLNGAYKPRGIGPNRSCAEGIDPKYLLRRVILM